MENSKIIQLLKTFKAKELRECGDWVASPFFNKNQELAALYEYLRKCAPQFSEKKTTREVVYKSIFPKKKYDEKHLNYLMSFLLKLVEQYLAYSKFTENPIQENIHVLQNYMSRGLDKHYHYVFEITKEKLQQYDYRNVDFYYLQFLLAETDNQYFLKQKIRKHDIRLQSAADYFDQYILANKLKYFCEMQDRKMSLAANYELHMLPEITTYTQKQDLQNYPGIKVYEVILKMLEDGDNTVHFFDLKVLIKNYTKSFPYAELKELYFYAINYCIRKVNQGNADFLKELFSVYETCLEEKLLLENDQLSPWTYKNIVGVALRLKEFIWVEKFIKDYNSLLAEEFRENAYNYNLAELYYYKKDYDKAINHLNKVAFSDVYYSFDTKKMLMKVYVEQNEIEALLSLIASFKIFIKRNQAVSESNKLAYENFIYVIQQFIKHQTERSAPEILQSIETLKPLADKSWLIEQYGKRFKLK